MTINLTSSSIGKEVRSTIQNLQILKIFIKIRIIRSLQIEKNCKITINFFDL